MPVFLLKEDTFYESTLAYIPQGQGVHSIQRTPAHSFGTQDHLERFTTRNAMEEGSALASLEAVRAAFPSSTWELVDASQISLEELQHLARQKRLNIDDRSRGHGA
jgi:hypothetical protein